VNLTWTKVLLRRQKSLDTGTGADPQLAVFLPCHTTRKETAVGSIEFDLIVSARRPNTTPDNYRVG